MSWLIAPDKFKGTHTAVEVAHAIAAGIGAEVEICPTADGGEGTLEVLVGALGGRRREHVAHDSLGRAIEASFGLLADGNSAIVEAASASGLGLIAAAERDPELASTYGTGELIAAAIAAGAQRVLVAAGGVAGTDGGSGAIEALEHSGGLGGAELIVLADVQTPFERAAEVFAAQKGADPRAVERLSARLQVQAAALPRDPRGLPMTGAAGGLAGGLWARYDARLVPGAAWVLDTLEFDRRLRATESVVTGEGRLDASTLEGKLVSEIAKRCARAGVPLHAVVGSNRLSTNEQAALGLDTVLEASQLSDIEGAGRVLAGHALAR
jgi:glycerate kinase